MYQPQRVEPSLSLPPRQAQAALALAQAIIPGSDRVARADEGTLIEARKLLDHLDPRAFAWVGRVQLMMDRAAILRTGKSFHRLSPDKQDRLLQQWEQDPVLRGPLNVLTLIYKLVHFDRRPIYEGLGGRLNVVEQVETPRWMEQVSRGDDWANEEDLEAEVVVVGTGAGGAVVGRELVEQGHAVVFIEEGEFLQRDRFTGSSRTAHQHFYRPAFSLGNAPMPVFVGRMVGGSTAVNGGTCFETPPWVLERWCEDFDTDAFAPERMAGYFDKVQEILEVAPSPRNLLGPIADVIARGADALGWSHFAIKRNAPGCDGQGFCDFGCRTDARKSTNLSYIPPALERGGMLITELRAERLLLEGDRTTGIECRSRSGGTVRVRAPTVIFAGGAVPTPAFLLRQGLCNSSGEVGKNLTLHPSGGVCGVLPERLDGMKHVPQGYGLDEFKREGVLITAANPDYNYAPIIFPVAGRRLMERMDKMEHVANFGVLVSDTGRGRVRLGPQDTPIISYNLHARDAERMKQGILRTAEMLRAAGATEVYPAVQPEHVLRTDADYRSFERRSIKPSEFPLTSYHPLGTCRMGRDPTTSVVDLDHAAHDIKGLYIVDGSTVPGPLGVNPQITIMALATRAAERIADRMS